MEKVSFAVAIRNHQAQHLLSNRELAKKMGTNANNIARWVQHGIRPQDHITRDICTKLGIPFENIAWTDSARSRAKYRVETRMTDLDYLANRFKSCPIEDFNDEVANWATVVMYGRLIRNNISCSLMIAPGNQRYITNFKPPYNSSVGWRIMADSDGIHVMIISQDTGGKLFDQILSEASFAEICKAMEFPFNPQQCLNPKKISIPAPE